MLGYLKGHILEKSGQALIVDVHGLGYEVFVMLAVFERAQKGAKVQMYIHHHIREDASTLYGFETIKERDFFRKLISVSGIGPKGALAVLSAAPMNEIIRAISFEDHSVFQSVSGIGPKTAKRVIIELKSHVDSLGIEETAGLQSSPRQEVIEALEQLGYSSVEIQSSVGGMDLSETTVEEAIKTILSQMQR